MKYFLLIFVFSFFLSSALAQPAAVQRDAPLIINHSCIDYLNIPQDYITTAKNTLRFGYGHTSHGSQLITGIDAIALSSSFFSYAYSSWGLEVGTFMNDGWGNAGGADDLGSDGSTGWADATRTMLSMPENDRNVVMWSWCGGLSWTDSANVQVYLDAMNQIENDYPDVVFVYMTGHLDGTGTDGNLNQRNEQIRRYCIANNKVLFDFADIESYAPGGTTNYMELLATDGCYYDSDGDGNADANWAVDWVNANTMSNYAQIASNCSECAHSETLNCVLKGSAFWWLAASLAGWESVTQADDNPEALPRAYSLLQNFPNPFNPETTISWELPESKFTTLQVYDILGNNVATLEEKMLPAGKHSAIFNASNLPSGIYFYRLTAGTFSEVRKMTVVK